MPNNDEQYSNNWQCYRHAMTRDLAWLLHSPPLFRSNLGRFSHFELDAYRRINTLWLRELDDKLTQSATTIQGLERAEFRRLGLYSEALLGFYLSRCGEDGPCSALIARNQQLIENGKTLGECDFLLIDNTGKACHIELAIKFYLQKPGGSAKWQDWVGPNRNDRLDLKLNTMIERQLEILHASGFQKAAQRVREDLNIEGAIQSYHMVKGTLFHHICDPKCVLPDGVDTQALTGKWAFFHEFCQHFNDQQHDFILCEKLEWMTGPADWKSSVLQGSVLEKIESLRSLHKREPRYNSPVVFLLMKGKEQHNQTYRPLILVPDYWPDTSSPRRNI